MLEVRAAVRELASRNVRKQQFGVADKAIRGVISLRESALVFGTHLLKQRRRRLSLTEYRSPQEAARTARDSHERTSS